MHRRDFLSASAAVFATDLMTPISGNAGSLLAPNRKRVPRTNAQMTLLLSRFRTELGKLKINTYIIPHTDQFGSKFLNPHDEMIKFLSDFTGSAGTLVVTPDRAVLFTDGRYEIQAKQQLHKPWEVVIITPENPRILEDWLQQHTNKNNSIGFNPWLHTFHEIENLKKVVEVSGAKLVSVDYDPVGALWQDRPAAKREKVEAYESGHESQIKRRVMAYAIQEENVQVFIITNPISIAWLLNIRGSDVPYCPLPFCYAVLHDNGTVDLFIDNDRPPKSRLEETLKNHLGSEVRIHTIQEFGSVLEQLGKSKEKIGVDYIECPYAVVQKLKTGKATLINHIDPCRLPRSINSEAEIKAAREAHIIDGAAVTRYLAWLDRKLTQGRTVTEMQGVDRLEQFRKENQSYRGPSFATCSATGADAALPHYNSTEETDKPITSGLYVCDSGGQYPGALTDTTRTLAVGRITAEMKTAFTRVLKGHIALASASFPAGTDGHQLDAIARSELTKYGLNYPHGTGHAVSSLALGDGFFLTPRDIPESRREIVPGMIYSDEPGYYKEGAFGIRIESLLLVVEDKDKSGHYKHEVLTMAPIDTRAMDISLLTEAEIKWINTYHQEVYAKLSPHILDQVTREWLKNATAPVQSSLHQAQLSEDKRDFPTRRYFLNPTHNGWRSVTA